MRGPAPVVDVQPVRLGTDRHDLGPGPPERLGRHLRRRAVRLVQHDLQTVEPVRQNAHEVGDIRVEALVVVPHAPDPGPGGPVPRRTGPVLLVDRLDPVLQLVGELVPAAGEELDPVVGHGVVAGGEHHAEVGAERAGEVGDGRMSAARRPAARPRPRWRARRPRRPPGTPRTRAGPARRRRWAGALRTCPPRPVRARRRRTGRAPSPPSDPRWRHRARRPCRRVVPLVLLRMRQYRQPSRAPPPRSRRGDGPARTADGCATDKAELLLFVDASDVRRSRTSCGSRAAGTRTTTSPGAHHGVTARPSDHISV